MPIVRPFSGWVVSNRKYVNDDEKQGMINEILMRVDYRFVAISPPFIREVTSLGYSAVPA